jgi:multidrug efflux pump
MQSLKSLKNLSDKFKEFKPTSWAINNRTAVYIITILISLYGITKFNTLTQRAVSRYCSTNH